MLQPEQAARTTEPFRWGTAGRPRGAATEENESAIDVVTKEFANAIGDRQRYGIAKTVTMSAQAQGVDLGDPIALADFLSDA